MPDTRYAKTHDGVHVAFQVLGSGTLDVLVVNFWFVPTEHLYAEPRVAGLLNQIASVGRVITFDRRGTGLSDPISAARPPTLEDWVQDVLAVLDAAESSKAAIVGVGEGAGLLAILFAASYPARTSALVLWHAVARLRWAEDYPWGWSADAIDSGDAQLRSAWARGGWPEPSGFGDEALDAWLATGRRHAASPGIAPLMRQITLDTDLRPILPTLAVPTLVLHHDEDESPVEHARYLAEHIPGARLVVLPGSRNLLAASDVLLSEAVEFLTGRRPLAQFNRVLTTILFTDIVGSTERLAEVGDTRWKEILDDHDRAVREQLRVFGGREINTTGDGLFASFDGPARAVRCAQAIGVSLQHLGLEVRAGVHTGECELRGDNLAGLAVHIAARVGAAAGPNEVLVSSTVKDLMIGSGIDFNDRGAHELKGVPGTWQLFAASS